MKIKVGAVNVELEERGDRVCAHIRDGGTFEPDTLALWGRLCIASKTRQMVDVGAYSGLFAIAAAMHGCKSFAFEPMPLNQKRIVINAHTNGVRDQIALHRLALADKPGTMKINFNGAVTGLTSGASLVNANLGKMPSSKMDVPVRTLDSFNFHDVAAIKIDVERAEPLVLLGARDTLARCKPALIVECLSGEELRAVCEAMPADYFMSHRMDDRNFLFSPTSEYKPRVP